DYEEQERKLEVLKKGFGKESGEYQAARAKALPKYIGTKEHALYKKGQLLFGMHAAARASRTLYVFEGNSDCVTASDRGLVNSVAVCGYDFSEAHFELAIKQGFKHFVFDMYSYPCGM